VGAEGRIGRALAGTSSVPPALSLSTSLSLTFAPAHRDGAGGNGAAPGDARAGCSQRRHGPRVRGHPHPGPRRRAGGHSARQVRASSPCWRAARASPPHSCEYADVCTVLTLVAPSLAPSLPHPHPPAPPGRRGDLVFLQNGMIAPWLLSTGLHANTQALLFFGASAAAAGGGAVLVRDGGRTVATGAHAHALAALLAGGGVRCQVGCCAVSPRLASQVAAPSTRWRA
jgi:hypothetical protein